MSKTNLEWAEEMWSERSNGACEGMSETKGGRAWLTGEFTLVDLEALCIILRDKAGERAEGFEEMKEIWQEMETGETK